MLIKLEVNCPECGEEIHSNLGDFTGGDAPTVNVSNFSQTDWHCDDCEKTFLIGDIDLIDSNDI